MNKLKTYSLKKETYKKIMALGLSTLIATSLTGCTTIEAAPVEEYDVVAKDNDSSFMSSGLKQILDIPGENFKLVAQYNCDLSSKRSWRITSDKFLYFNVSTQGLPSDTIVYIDNIHIDTSIKSKYAVMDGILQDSMDDRVHNSIMLGFPISDDVMYYGVNAIEGCNQDFIQGSFFGMNGYSSGEIEQKRYTESDYIDLKVYANKIQIVYDLLIKGPKDKDYRNVSVCTDFLVPIDVANNTQGKIRTLKKL